MAKRIIVDTQATSAPTTSTSASATKAAEKTRIEGQKVFKTIAVNATSDVWKGKGTTLNVCIDFTGVDEKLILEWAAQNRVIALQNVLRAAGPGFVESLKAEGTFYRKAVECGSTITSAATEIHKRFALLDMAPIPMAFVLQAVTGEFPDKAELVKRLAAVYPWNNKHE